jgi:xanthine dehydrogenase accessory factor
MKELRDIVQAFELANTAGKRTALATVVHIEGSSYRQPGARMLVTDDGMLTGAISGGCLEGDALRKALLVIVNNAPMLVTYDTNDEDDAKIGIGLGCNGIIQILIEPIDASDTHNPIAMIRQLLSQRSPAVLATIFSYANRKSTEAGTKFLMQNHEQWRTQMNDELLKQLTHHAMDTFTTGHSVISSIDYRDHHVLFSLVYPALSMIIVGGGNDVSPLVSIAYTLGWETTVIDGRRNYATASRFPAATRLMTAKPAEAISQLSIDERSVVLLMTHNYNYDYVVLKQVLNSPAPYIGILGPRKKTDRMLTELEGEGIIVNNIKLQRIFGPTGLDTGAENSEEIALSICAEINAVLNARPGGSLRIKEGPIHDTSSITTL